MNEKKYRHRTKYFGIPVPGHNQPLLSEVELRKWQLVENLLLAATRGMANCIFDEGTIRLKKNQKGKYDVKLQSDGASHSLVGVVAWRYFEAPHVLLWSDLEPGYRYSLYVKGSTKTSLDTSKVRTVMVRGDRQSDSMLLVAVANLRDINSPFVDVSPPGKVYSRDLARHIMDKTNPHGVEMFQNTLTVTERLVLGSDAVLEVRGDETAVEIPSKLIDQVVDGVVRSPEVVDLASGGSQGVVGHASGPVAFVQVSQRMTGDDIKSLGEVAVGYHPQDKNASDETTFVVYNSGDKGIPLRAVVLRR